MRSNIVNKQLFFHILIVSVLTIVPCICNDSRGFDDSILYTINWPGEENLLGSKDVDELSETIIVKSSQKEKYSCKLPKLLEESSTENQVYLGLTPLQLLKPLFFQKICSYRLESYWSYEICHGQYVRQYHEEREGKKVKVQEYFLGRFDEIKFDMLEAQLSKAPLQLNHTKLDGVSLPYVEIFMDDGTLCDLNGAPRSTRVRYVCHASGRHEVYSLKEMSTCHYEIIILSPLLCQHPLYKPKEQAENVVSCFPLDGAPKKPRNLLKMEAESQKLRQQSVRPAFNSGSSEQDVVAVLKFETVDEDGETRVKWEIHPMEPTTTPENLIENRREEQPDVKRFDPLTRKPTLNDPSPVKEFLKGEHCLSGGTGWWKYEFCYGKHVQQYHVDRNGAKSSVLLGTFDIYEHRLWLKQNPNKAPIPGKTRSTLTHFYSHGEICDKTGRPRQTEVRLKCLENSSSVGQVSLYLLEPRTCHYILGVESPIICEIYHLADEDGLIPEIKDDFESLSEPEHTKKIERKHEQNKEEEVEAKHIEL